MKKIIVLFLMLVLGGSVAHAGIFDWITGWIVEGTEVVKEQVKCAFINANSEQKCYTSDGKFACSGTGSCIADVSGERDTKLLWKSSCGGETYTAIDGGGESIEFKCEPTVTQTPIPVAELIKEQVKCNFLNFNTEQKCYTSDGNFACSGTGSCENTVSGASGMQLIWKSSCGGYAYTVIDGNNEAAEFKCETQSTLTQTTPTTTTASQIKEQVKCVFLNSNTEQKCYTSDGNFACSGTGSCIADIIEDNGKKIEWKSSCGGYAYTVADGNFEYAEFKCEQPAATTATSTQIATPMSTPAPTSTRDKVRLHYFYWEKECPSCESEKSFLEKLKAKYSQVEYDSYSIDNPLGGNVYSYFVAANLKKEMPTIFLDKKIWTGYDDNIAAEIENKVSSCLEKGCSLTPVAPVPKIAAAQTTQTSIPLMPVQEVPPTAPDMVKEQVECIFWNSDVLKNPHTARPEECYGNKFGCKWTGEVVEKESEVKKARYAHCIAEVSGEKGTQLVWKSSCGGYAYTLIDGNNEAAEFKCTPSSEVKEEQISGKGFKRAYWQCYDGAEQKEVLSADVSCKSSEEWQERAKEFCKDHCYADKSKCGVNSFSVMDECYIEAGKEGIIFATPEKPKGGKKFAMPPNSKIGDIMVVYFYSDACRFCLGMDGELNKVSKELNININRVNIINEPELAESYGIKGVPAFLVLRYESDGIKEFTRYGKADSTAIINWIAKPAAEAQEKPAEIEKLKEEILICKDSCPLDGKCYPFGYRKGGKYCSDEGAFKEQLKADAVCDNNFECSTNVCVDGKCISSGFIEKMTNWFKRLFG